MDAVKYFKEARRMCNTHKACEKCPIKSLCVTSYEHIENPEKIVSLVENWVAEHPAKTRQSEFLKMFPKARRNDSGVLVTCPVNVDGTFKCARFKGKFCGDCLEEYWLAEVE